MKVRLEVDMVPDGTDEDGNPTFEHLERAIADEIANICRERWRALAEAEIVKQIGLAIQPRLETEIERAFSGPITLTNAYGQKTGETTLPDLVQQQGKLYLEQRVSNDGCLNSSSAVPRAVWLVTQLCRDAIGDFLKGQEAALKEELARQFPTLLSDALVKSLRK